MQSGESVKAFAKINLHLQVLNRRTDGYHNILSFMAHIDLCDLLKLEKADILPARGEINVSIRNAGGINAGIIDSIPTEENLISRSARKYLEALGYSGEIVFSIEKNIPAGAGLGGGSSDAAIVLKMLSEYLNEKEISLVDMGATIGADVPFNILGGYALCEGIGEIIEPLSGVLDYKVLLVNNGIHVETGRAYSMLGRNEVSRYEKAEINMIKGKIRESLSTGSLEPARNLMINDFEGPVFSLYPELGTLKEEILSYGSDFAIMTGSGSTIIGLFSDEKKAVEAEKCLKKKAQLVMLTKFR